MTPHELNVEAVDMAFAIDPTVDLDNGLLLSIGVSDIRAAPRNRSGVLRVDEACRNGRPIVNHFQGSGWRDGHHRSGWRKGVINRVVHSVLPESVKPSLDRSV